MLTLYKLCTVGVGTGSIGLHPVQLCTSTKSSTSRSAGHSLDMIIVSCDFFPHAEPLQLIPLLPLSQACRQSKSIWVQSSYTFTLTSTFIRVFCNTSTCTSVQNRSTFGYRDQKSGKVLTTHWWSLWWTLEELQALVLQCWLHFSAAGWC